MWALVLTVQCSEVIQQMGPMSSVGRESAGLKVKLGTSQGSIRFSPSYCTFRSGLILLPGQNHHGPRPSRIQLLL